MTALTRAPGGSSQPQRQALAQLQAQLSQRQLSPQQHPRLCGCAEAVVAQPQPEALRSLHGRLD